jgi:hypothetical protein
MIDAVALDREVQRQRTVYRAMKARRAAPWMRTYRRELDATIRREQHAERLAAIDAEAAATRRRKEAAAREDKRRALAIYAGLRKPSGPSRTPVSLLVWRAREVTEAYAGERPVPPHVAREFDHLRALCRRSGIAVVTGADTQNGYARRTRKWVEIPAHQSMWTAATFAHEIGHVVGPPASTKVLGELGAWAWGRGHLLIWDADCDENQRGSLLSYRPQGTPAEQAEIDRVVSRRSFAEERQRRVMTGEDRWRT